MCGLQANVDIRQLESEHGIVYAGAGYDNRQVRAGAHTVNCVARVRPQLHIKTFTNTFCKLCFVF